MQLRRREVGCVVQGRQTARTCLHQTAHEGSQGIVCRLVGAVNLRQVEVRSNAVDLLGRIAGARAGRRISVGSGKCQGGVVWPADRVAHRNGDGHRGTVVEGQIHVVIHELTEGVGERRQRLLVDRVDVLRWIGGIRLAVDDVGNQARAGILGQRRRIVPVGVLGRGKAQEIGARDTPVRMGDIVADFVDGTIPGRGRGDRRTGRFGRRVSPAVRTRATVPSGDGRSRFMQPGLPAAANAKSPSWFACSLAGECPGVRGDPWFVIQNRRRESCPAARVWMRRSNRPDDKTPTNLLIPIRTDSRISLVLPSFPHHERAQLALVQ